MTHRFPASGILFDRYLWPFTALLHYTSKDRQPWIHHRHTLSRLWFNYLFSAIDADYIQEGEVRASAENGFSRPSITYQLEHRLADARRLPDHIKQEDNAFISACAKHAFNNVPGVIIGGLPPSNHRPPEVLVQSFQIRSNFNRLLPCTRKPL